MPEKKVTSLVWFRNNLRVIDNLSLKKSVENSDKVIGYINIDPNIIKTTSYGFKKTEKFVNMFQTICQQFTVWQQFVKILSQQILPTILSIHFFNTSIFILHTGQN